MTPNSANVVADPISTVLRSRTHRGCPTAFYETAGGVKIKLVLMLVFFFNFSLLRKILLLRLPLSFLEHSSRASIRTLLGRAGRCLLVSDFDELGAAIYRTASNDLGGGRSRREHEVGKVTAKSFFLPIWENRTVGGSLL